MYVSMCLCAGVHGFCLIGIYDSTVFLEANSFQFTVPVATFSYTIGQWGGCSVSCGTGLKSRSVFCKDDLTNQQALLAVAD